MANNFVAPTPHLISAKSRSQKYGHEGGVIWLTGLSGSGKSSLSMTLEESLFSLDYSCYVLDGDNLRTGLNSDLGFSKEDRSENIRRAAEVAHLFAKSGAICIVALISPLTADRKIARKIVNQSRFFEVYISADLETCITRDTKGLYRKAMHGQLADFTGISAPYEPPEQPDLAINTALLSQKTSAALLLSFVLQKFPKQNLANNPCQ